MDEDRQFYEDSLRRVILIDGRPMLKDQRIIGRCHYIGHQGYLTADLIKEHQCIEKRCALFQKFEEKTYWQNYKKMLQEKEKNKAAKKARKELERKKMEELSLILSQAKTFCEENKYKIVLTNIKREKNKFIIYFVSNFRKNDRWHYKGLSDYLTNLYKENGYRFDMVHIKNPNGTYADINDYNNK